MKELKSYAYYTTQIQQKSAQIVGMVGLELYLPPISYTNVAGQTCQLSYFDSEVQYFIVDGHRQLAEEIRQNIIFNVNRTLKKNVNIENGMNELKSHIPNIVLHFEMNQRQATIAVYCFQITQDKLMRVKSWRKFVDNQISSIIKQVQQAAVCYQFTGLHILQLVVYQNQITINLSLGRYTFNVMFGLSDMNWKETDLEAEIKNSILFSALKQDILFNATQPIYIDLQSQRFTDSYKKQFWRGKTRFIYFCKKELNITIQQLCLVRYKAKIYLNNICQLIAEYLRNSESFSPQIHNYVTQIMQESDQETIFSIFQDMCEKIEQKDQT